MDAKKKEQAFVEWINARGAWHLLTYEEIFIAGYEAALAQPAQGEVEGWKSVPIEPTDEMIAEAISEYVGDVDALETYRAMLSAAPTAKNQSNDVPERLWQSLFWDLAIELKCLPSSFVDANEHVFNKARKLIALSGESGISFSSKKPTIFHDREATRDDLSASLIDALKNHIPYRDESGVIGFALHDYGRILQLAEALEPRPPADTIAVPRSEWEQLVRSIKQADEALAYAAFNIDGSKLENLPAGIVESTGAAESALIAQRDLRAAIKSTGEDV